MPGFYVRRLTVQGPRRRTKTGVFSRTRSAQAAVPSGCNHPSILTEYGSPVEIGPDVWVGGGALILPGVHIGARTIIGAGSVVKRDIPAGVLAAGNPCRVINE